MLAGQAVAGGDSACGVTPRHAASLLGRENKKHRIEVTSISATQHSLSA